MKKIAVFAEGQTELIFVREYILKVYDNSKIGFRCIKLISDGMREVPYKHESPTAEYFFLLIDVSNDSKVLSAIRDREKDLIDSGFGKVIGIRDMYCREYDEKTDKQISEQLNEQFAEAANQEISKMNNCTKIKFIFSIMEVEAWFLSLIGIFNKIDPNLTLEIIEERLGYNLAEIDPQKEFYKPSVELTKILGIVGIEYKKKKSNVEAICSKIDPEDILYFNDGQSCESFRKFNNIFLGL